VKKKEFLGSFDNIFEKFVILYFFFDGKLYRNTQ